MDASAPLDISQLSSQALQRDPDVKALYGTSKTRSPQEIKKAAEDSEAVYLAQMFSQMFAGVKADKTFGGGNAEDIFKSMMNQEYGKAVAKKGGIGIAPMIERELIKLQEMR